MNSTNTSKMMDNADTQSTQSRQGLRRANSVSKQRFTDIAARLQQQIKREKEQASNDFLSYEKIRWPHYKDIIFRRKNQTYLPQNPGQIKKMHGLVRAAPGAAQNIDTKNRGNSSARNRIAEKSALASTTDLKASVNAGKIGRTQTEQPTQITNAQGQIVPLNTNNEQKSVIVFDADFESANLDQVRLRANNTFDCFMRNDTNGNGNLQWFYFRIKNNNEFMDTVRINIVNFTKGNSLFHHGMKPSVWSTKMNRNLEEGEGGWAQDCCNNVTYEQSTYQKEINDLNPQRQRAYWTMGFDYTFMYPSDEVYIAYTVPYTYTQMNAHIKQMRMLTDESHYKFMKFDTLGSSNGNFDIPLIKITNKSKGDPSVAKPIIFIIGRQHCGETHSSFILHGFINFLCSREVICHKMRDLYEFWIAPIVNPDGVIAGNYRCNTQGKDMNRHFFADDDPEGLKIRLTEVELIRSYLKQKMPAGENMFKMFLDIHAHSAQNSIFCYAPVDEDAVNMSIIKRFPMILDNLSPYFSYDNSKFGNERYKKNCARLGIFRDWNIVNSFTIESSCYAYELKGTDEVEQFKEDHFLKFGEHLLFGIAKHLNCEVTDQDKAGMTHGFDIELDYGLYTKESREGNKKGKNKRRRGDGDKDYKRRRRINSKMGNRQSTESLFRGSGSSWAGKDSRHGWRKNRDDDVSSRHSRARNNLSQNKAHISQTKFEMNPPGFSDEQFSTMNNGVVLIMNQSQRDYFKQGMSQNGPNNQRGIKLVTMSGLADNQTKAKVLSMLQNERGINSRQGRGKVDSRQSNNRRHNSSRQYNKYSSSIESGLGHQSTDGTYDNMHFGREGGHLNRNDFDQHLFDQFNNMAQVPGQPISSSKQTEFEQALFAQFKMQDQAKKDPNLYTPPHAPTDTARKGMPEVINPKGKRNRKVVITIKQQAADGSMIPTTIPQGALQAMAAQNNMGGAPMHGQPDGQTVFKAQVHVDREKQKQITKRNQTQVDDNLFELIKELHNQHSNQRANGMIQGMGLDPSMIDNYQNKQAQMQQQMGIAKQGRGGEKRFAGAAQEIIDGSMRKEHHLLGSEHPSLMHSPQNSGTSKANMSGRKTPNRNNRRLIENNEMSNRMQQALAAQQNSQTGNSNSSIFGPGSQQQRLNNDPGFRQIISNKDIGGSGFMLPQVGQAILDTHSSPMQHKMANPKALHSPSDGYHGFQASSPSPGGIPKEVLQAAAMSGGTGGRRNIKIRAVQKGAAESAQDVVNCDKLMQALSNQQISPMSMKDHAQMQFMHQRRISNALQSQTDAAKQRQLDAMSNLDQREPSRQRNMNQQFNTEKKGRH